jgi:hypothetical protein
MLECVSYILLRLLGITGSLSFLLSQVNYSIVAFA